jgi:hypothetical protein
VGLFNVLDTTARCARCGAPAGRIQFRYGLTWQLEYSLGDRVRWGGGRSDVGEPGHGRVVVVGIGEGCAACGNDDERYFDIEVRDDVFVSARPASGEYGLGEVYFVVVERLSTGVTVEPFERLLAGLKRNVPASDLEIAAFERGFGHRLPEDYRAFLRLANGAEGFVGDAYVALYELDHILERHRMSDESEYLVFGSNGGGEAFAFDCSRTRPPVVLMPFIGGSEHISYREWTFTQFMESLMDIGTSVMISGALHEFAPVPQFFGAYFHQDWMLDDPDDDAVIARYVRDAGNADRARELAVAIDELVAAIADDGALARLLYGKLGCSYLTNNARAWMRDVARRLRELS